MVLSGSLSEDLAHSTIAGISAKLPLLQAPAHILVLKRLKLWLEVELISLPMYKEMQATVLLASAPEQPQPPTLATTSTIDLTNEDKVPKSAHTTTSTSSRKRKVKDLPVQQNTLFQAMPGAKKTLIKFSEIQKQRMAASKNTHYSPERLIMSEFPTETQGEDKPPVLREYLCGRCGRSFDSAIGLRNHSVSHGAGVKHKFASLPPQNSYHMHTHSQHCGGLPKLGYWHCWERGAHGLSRDGG